MADIPFIPSTLVLLFTFYRIKPCFKTIRTVLSLHDLTPEENGSITSLPSSNSRRNRRNINNNSNNNTTSYNKEGYENYELDQRIRRAILEESMLIAWDLYCLVLAIIITLSGWRTKSFYTNFKQVFSLSYYLKSFLELISDGLYLYYLIRLPPTILLSKSLNCCYWILPSCSKSSLFSLQVSFPIINAISYYSLFSTAFYSLSLIVVLLLMLQWCISLRFIKDPKPCGKDIKPKRKKVYNGSPIPLLFIL